MLTGDPILKFLEHHLTTNIHILPEETINKIRAGEVVENPTSVIKELIENALDAGAREIEVSIKKGGLQEIVVSDDGYGMHKDDALRAIERHATSKIQSEKDLESLSTMGFRGEALAAILSVAKLTIVTRSKRCAYACFVASEGGKDVIAKTAARNVGTTVSVKSLFFNAPARKRFQKSPAGCSREIHQMLKKLALSRPEVAFKLNVDEQKIMEVGIDQSLTYQEACQKRIKEIFGEERYRYMRALENQTEDGTVFGMAGKPSFTAPTKKEQVIVVNQRLVYCEEIAEAITQAYATTIDKGRFPLYALYLEIPAKYLDVNIHPQKKEIKLCLTKKVQIQQLISDAITKTFFQTLASQTPWEFPHITSDSTFRFQEEMAVVPCKEYSVNNLDQPTLPFEEKPKPRLLGIFGQYLIGNWEEKLFLFDLLRAHRWVFYQRLEKALQDQQPVEMQKLLFPLQLSFPKDEAQEILGKIERLKSFGVEMRSFGEREFIVEALSSYIEEKDVQEYISAVHRCESLLIKHWRVLAEFVGKSKQNFTITEAEILFNRIPSYVRCPRGEPLCIYLSQKDIYEFFRKN